MSSINSINPVQAQYTAATQSSGAVAKPETETTTAVPKVREDIYTKSGDVDRDKVNEMKTELNNNMAAFRQMVETAMNTQGRYQYTSLVDLLKDFEVDEETQLEAQAAIAEDGYWGVEQTAERILDFAKALSGGDEGKIEMLRGAVLAGFDAAEKTWGGTLPEISYQTKDRVMEGFDVWKDSFTEEPVAE